MLYPSVITMLMVLVVVIVIIRHIENMHEVDTNIPGKVLTAQEEAFKRYSTQVMYSSCTCPRNHVLVERERVEEARREALRVRRCEAFTMGQQERLGKASLVMRLDPDVVRMVLNHM
jgi:predicted Holliday junction resolvase-like endonuclease